jgi:hypothetical protein
MARGNRGQKVFADVSNRRRWLDTLGEACAKTGWCVHAFVLMGNHYHLLAFRQAKGYQAYVEGRVLELAVEGGRKRLEAEWKFLSEG